MGTNILTFLNESTHFELNSWNPEIREGISLITAVKNRSETLREAIQTWISHKEIDEIIIVDWSSDESLVPLVEEFQDGRIFLAIVKDQPTWILSYAYNLAARLSSRDKLLKIDADVKILPNFFKSHVLTPGVFYTGNWRLGKDENETHLNGNLFLYRHQYFQANGYNEFIKSYGWDDSDLFSRLDNMGLQQLDFVLSELYHIPHENRTTYQSTTNFLPYIGDLERSHINILMNRYLATGDNSWRSDCVMTNYDIEILDKNTIRCYQQKKESFDHPDNLILKSHLMAIKDRFQQLGIEIPEKIFNQLSRDEIIAFYTLVITKELHYPGELLVSLIRKLININELDRGIPHN